MEFVAGLVLGPLEAEKGFGWDLALGWVVQEPEQAGQNLKELATRPHQESVLVVVALVED